MIESLQTLLRWPVLAAFALLLSLQATASGQTTNFDHADCWLKSYSGYGVSFFGTNPTAAELRTAIGELAATYHVPVEVIGAVCQQESSAFQYGADGFVVHNLSECQALHAAHPSPNGPPGLGLMQLTGATAGQFDIPRLITDWRYNLDAGVKTLVDKYEVSAAREDTTLRNLLRANSDVLENWFNPLAFYNGYFSGNPYPFNVYAWMSSVPERLVGLYTAVTPTVPAAVVTDWSYTHSFVAARTGTWTCAHGTTYTGSVHVGAGAGGPALPVAGVRANGLMVTNGQTTPVLVGSVSVSSAAPSIVVTVTNTGGQVLTWTAAVAPSAFSVSEVTSTSLRVGESGTFRVTLATGSVGLKIARLTITSNAGSFAFDVKGRVIPTEAPFADYHHAECWLESTSNLGVNFYGENPTSQELRAEIANTAALYNVPAEVIGATCIQMSSGFQYGRDGFVVHNISRCIELFRGASGGPPGIGLFALSGGTAQAFDVGRLITDWRYSLRSGVRILVDQYELALGSDPSTIQNLLRANPGVVENWYYGLAIFAGPRNDTEFTRQIYDWIANPPPRITGLYSPVIVTEPAAVITHFTPGHSFAAQPNGSWTCSDGATWVGPVHSGTGLGALIPPSLTVLDPSGAVLSAQSAPVEFPSVARFATATPRTFTIRNDGGGVLNWNAVVSTGFINTFMTSRTLYAGESGTVQIALDTSPVGTRTSNVQITVNGSGGLTFPIRGTVTAAPFAITVSSSTPDTGVTVTTNVTDTNGVISGPTPLSLTHYTGAQLLLSVPFVAAGQHFQRWQRDGFDVPGGTVLAITAANFSSYRAVYGPPPGTATQLTNYFHEECWLRRSSGYGVSFTGTNPTPAQLQEAIRTMAARFKVPVEILGGVCQQESSTFQYGADGFVVHNLAECTAMFRGTRTDFPPGLGLMQLTASTASTFEIGRLITDWQYNLESGVKVLVEKYEVAVSGYPGFLQTPARSSSTILENWFYPLAQYNGYFDGNTYPFLVYNWIANMPVRLQGLHASTAVTIPSAGVPDWFYGHPFVARSNGQWTCGHDITTTATVHAGTGTSTPLRTFTIASTTPDSGVAITASRADSELRASGTTPFTLSYLDSSQVTLTAPASASGRTFQVWQKDGVDVPNSTAALVATADAAHTYRAVYRASGPVLAALVTPAPGSTLTATSATLTWSAGTGATEYYLDVGTTVNGSQILSANVGTALQRTVTNLPGNGSTIFIKLWSKINGAWLFNSYQLTAVDGRAELTAPAPSSTLTGSNATFSWTAGAGVLEYWLDVGTTLNGAQLSTGSKGLVRQATVSNLPANGTPIFVRLFSRFSTGWAVRNYQLTAVTGVKANLLTPTPGSTLTATSATLTWSAGVGVSEYYLDVGTTVNGSQILSASLGTALQRTVTVPGNGGTIFIKLWSKLGGAWVFNNYQLTAVDGRAELTAPAPSSTLTGSTATFSWTAGAGVLEYWLDVGTTLNGAQLSTGSTGLVRQATVSNLPSNGSPIFVRLFSRFSTGWTVRAYQLTAVTGVKANLLTPAPGSTLTATTATLTWSAGVGVTEYYLDVGTTLNGSQILSANVGTALQRTVTNLPANSGTIFVRLWSKMSGAWVFTNYQLTAMTAVKAALVSPAPGSTLTGTSVSFSWNAGVGATEYYLDVGRTAGGTDLSTGSTGLNLSKTVSGLPADGRTLFVRLWSKINGAWVFTDYQVIARR